MGPLIRWLVRLFVVVLLLAAVYLAYLFATLPDVDHLIDENPEITSYIERWAEEAGVPAANYRIQTWSPYDQIAPLLIDATVLSEDTGYYEHKGVEWELTRQMARRMLSGRKFTGASTITQQLARNLFLHSEVSVHRKIQEIMIAMRLEKTLTKERILEIYLNVVEWGEGVWGIARAAEFYFEKTPTELNPFECVFLPVLLPAPRRELTGSNLYRANGVFRRLCYYLHKNESLSLDEWVYAKRGLGELEIALKSGASLREAINRAEVAAMLGTP